MGDRHRARQTLRPCKFKPYPVFNPQFLERIMTMSLYITNRPITASDQASPVAIATTITSASGGSPSDWFAHSDITPLPKPMTAAIGIGSGEPLSENAPDPFADSGPSIFLQDDQPFAHDPDFYNGHGLIPAIKKEIWSKISRQVFLLPRKNLKRPSFLLRKTT